MELATCLIGFEGKIFFPPPGIPRAAPGAWPETKLIICMCIVTVDHTNKLMHWIFRKIQGNWLIKVLSPFIRYAKTEVKLSLPRLQSKARSSYWLFFPPLFFLLFVWLFLQRDHSFFLMVGASHSWKLAEAMQMGHNSEFRCVCVSREHWAGIPKSARSQRLLNGSSFTQSWGGRWWQNMEWVCFGWTLDLLASVLKRMG